MDFALTLTTRIPLFRSIEVDMWASSISIRQIALGDCGFCVGVAE
jgi:hypothetical protein